MSKADGKVPEENFKKRLAQSKKNIALTIQYGHAYDVLKNIKRRPLLSSFANMWPDFVNRSLYRPYRKNFYNLVKHLNLIGLEEQVDTLFDILDPRSCALSQCSEDDINFLKGIEKNDWQESEKAREENFNEEFNKDLEVVRDVVNLPYFSAEDVKVLRNLDSEELKTVEKNPQQESKEVNVNLHTRIQNIEMVGVIDKQYSLYKASFSDQEIDGIRSLLKKNKKLSAKLEKVKRKKVFDKIDTKKLFKKIQKINNESCPHEKVKFSSTEMACIKYFLESKEKNNDDDKNKIQNILEKISKANQPNNIFSGEKKLSDAGPHCKKKLQDVLDHLYRLFHVLTEELLSQSLFKENEASLKALKKMIHQFARDIGGGFRLVNLEKLETKINDQLEALEKKGSTDRLYKNELEKKLIYIRAIREDLPSNAEKDEALGNKDKKVAQEKEKRKYFYLDRDFLDYFSTEVLISEHDKEKILDKKISPNIGAEATNEKGRDKEDEKKKKWKEFEAAACILHLKREKEKERRKRRRKKLILKIVSVAVASIVGLGEGLVAAVFSIGLLGLPFIPVLFLVGIPATIVNFLLFRPDCYSVLKDVFSGRFFRRKTDGKRLSKLEKGFLIASVIFSASSALAFGFLSLGSAVSGFTKLFVILGIAAGPHAILAIAGIVAFVTVVALTGLFLYMTVNWVRNEGPSKLIKKIRGIPKNISKFFSELKEASAKEIAKKVTVLAVKAVFVLLAIAAVILMNIATAGLFKGQSVAVFHGIFHTSMKVANIVSYVFIVGFGEVINGIFDSKGLLFVFKLFKNVALAIGQPRKTCSAIKNSFKIAFRNCVSTFNTIVSGLKRGFLLLCVAINTYGQVKGIYQNAEATRYSHVMLGFMKLKKRVIRIVNGLLSGGSSWGPNTSATLNETVEPEAIGKKKKKQTGDQKEGVKAGEDQTIGDTVRNLQKDGEKAAAHAVSEEALRVRSERYIEGYKQIKEVKDYSKATSVTLFRPYHSNSEKSVDVSSDSEEGYSNSSSSSVDDNLRQVSKVASNLTRLDFS